MSDAGAKRRPARRRPSYRQLRPRAVEPDEVDLFDTTKRRDAVGSYQMVDVSQVEARNGIFRALTDQLGVAGFRINQLELAAGAEGPEHDHIGNDQEEVYAVVAGGGVLRTDGEEIPLRAGHFVHLPPDVRRQMVAGDQGLTWIGIGSATD
jgi:quercetin dioxygenase-like cupin family protein